MRNYVNHYTAILAEHRGFNLGCNHFFTRETKQETSAGEELFQLTKEKLVRRPTQAELQTWIREEKFIIVWVEPALTAEKKPGYVFRIGNRIMQPLDEGIVKNVYERWEQALEKGLQETLKIMK